MITIDVRKGPAAKEIKADYRSGALKEGDLVLLTEGEDNPPMLAVFGPPKIGLRKAKSFQTNAAAYLCKPMKDSGVTIPSMPRVTNANNKIAVDCIFVGEEEVRQGISAYLGSADGVIYNALLSCLIS